MALSCPLTHYADDGLDGAGSPPAGDCAMVAIFTAPEADSTR